MKKLFCILIVMLMVFGLAACSTAGETASEGTETQSAAEASASSGVSSGTTETVMTDAGTLRSETLVVTMPGGRWTGEMKFNPYNSGSVYQGNGFRALVWEHLWNVDSSTGEQICVLAEDFPVSEDDTYTKFEVKLRQGVKWSDGYDFTADDLVFTSELLLSTPDISYAAAFSAIVKSITKVDDYTVLIETVNKETRLEQKLGLVSGDTKFRILPKHIWENVDAPTYGYMECIGTGPYTLADYDENGNYFLFEKRDDVECSANTMVYGEPVPKYVLFECFGEEDTTIMAAVNNQLDCYTNASFESVQVLLEQNTEAKSWYDNYPYGRTSTEPHGILFNCAVEPLDSVNVRWALTLALSAEDLTMAAFDGAAKVSPVAIPATDAMSEMYIEPLTEWLEGFTLSDGYRPFNSSYAENIAETLTSQGIEGIPTDTDELIDMFGVGWWKNDTTEAGSLLLAEGFTKGSDGMWLKPDGTPWQITITISAAEDIYARVAYTITNAWKKFGIDAVVNAVDTSSFQTALSQGLSDCYVMWTNNCEITDFSSVSAKWSSKFIVPVGESTSTGYGSGACARFSNGDIDAIAEELDGLMPGDSRAEELITEYIKTMVENAPFVVMYENMKNCPVTTHYWTGYPDSENPYETNCWWFANFCHTLANVKATGNQ